MRKTNLLFAVLLIVLFTVFAMGSSEDTSSTQEPGKVSTESKVEGAIGDYSVVIDSCRLAEDYEGDPVVIVKYIFTNIDREDSISFSTAFMDYVYQNGVGLNKAYLLDDNTNYSSDNQTKEIKKEASIEVEVAYELNDTTTDIEVEVEEFTSFNETKITRTFSIAE